MGLFECEHILGIDGKPIETLVTASFTGKEILNSNSMPRNTFILSKRKKAIRTSLANWGSYWHTDSVDAMAAVELSRLQAEKSRAKSSARKEMNKDKVPTTEQDEVFALIEKDFAPHISDLELAEDKLKGLYLYDSCSLSVGVSPPSKRIIDPPNFHPTLKPFIDGLTEALWWEDDNFNYITSTEFHHEKPNKQKLYIFTVDIKRNM